MSMRSGRHGQRSLGQRSMSSSSFAAAVRSAAAASASVSASGAAVTALASTSPSTASPLHSGAALRLADGSVQAMSDATGTALLLPATPMKPPPQGDNAAGVEDDLSSQLSSLIVGERSEDVLAHTNGLTSGTVFGDASDDRVNKPLDKDLLELDPTVLLQDGWEQTLRRCAQAVVSIRVNLVRSFDTERANSSQATGFIVDIERGIILTNRHVITPGPISAEAVFFNHEEAPLYPVYRDPVHDFGFFRFDVSKVRYSKLSEIPLAPQLARIGMDVRVMGNDSAEKLSILAGTLARLDRPAPFYGLGKYNDFNTFYFQAASGTSGGSSGSPVLDMQGNAIAMNAGGKKNAASSFYIPLNRVQRALQLVQMGKMVMRGTVQCVFRHDPFDEVRRLGLSPQTEDAVRRAQPNVNGMLVADHVTPKGPSHRLLEPGDVVISINGSIVTDFVALEELLDASVGQTISIVVERGGKRLEFSINVGDLHAITPSSYVTISGAILHELSYQMAYSYGIQVGGVYVASSGYMLSMAGISRNCVITMVNNQPTPTIKAFVEVMLSLEDNIRVPFRFINLADLQRDRISIVQVDRHWHVFAECKRDDATGIWTQTPFPDAKSYHMPPVSSVALETTEKLNQAATALLPSLVTVEAHLPFIIDGVHSSSFIGAGLVVDAERGLVVIDGNTVPIAVADVNVSFASSLVVPGRVVFHHPTHNFAVVAYDPKLIGDTPVRSAKISRVPLVQGDRVTMVGLTKAQQLVYRPTAVSSIHEMTLRECNPSRFRATNIDAIEVDHPLSCLGGVLADEDGTVRALWACYSYQENEGDDTQTWCGLDMRCMMPVLVPLMSGAEPRVRSLEIECWPYALASARAMGLQPEWVARFEKASTGRRSVQSIRRLTAATPAADLLKEGDVLLTANDRLVTCFSDLECQNSCETVALRILRDGKEMVVDVPTVPISGLRTVRIVGWAGVILQAPHRPVAQQHRELPGLVYSSYWANGSPAHMYNLRATVWITEVNGIPVPDLDRFLGVVRGLDSSTYVRIKTVDFSSRVKVLTLKPDHHYWPLWELRRDSSQQCGWRLLSERDMSALK